MILTIKEDDKGNPILSKDAKKFVENLLSNFDFEKMREFHIGYNRARVWKERDERDVYDLLKGFKCRWDLKIGSWKAKNKGGIQMKCSIPKEGADESFFPLVFKDSFGGVGLEGGLYKYIWVDIVIKSKDEAIIYSFGHALFYFLRSTKQIPVAIFGRNSSVSAARFAFFILHLWKTDKNWQEFESDTDFVNEYNPLFIETVKLRLQYMNKIRHKNYHGNQQMP